MKKIAVFMILLIAMLLLGCATQKIVVPEMATGIASRLAEKPILYPEMLKENIRFYEEFASQL
ncbi:hypothetical protein ES703_84596 [subsurface metagenome]